MTDIRDELSVRVAGIDDSGVRTLIGNLSGTLQPSSSGERIWDSSRIAFSAGRPDLIDFEEVDALIVVVSARQGVPAAITHLWMSAAEAGIPAFITVTHLDDSTVDLEEAAAMCMRALNDGGEIFMPWLPILDDDEAVCGFIDLLSEEIVDWSDGGPVVRASEQRHQELIEDARAELCESIMLAVDDDELFAQYMAGDAIDGEDIEHHMLEQISRGLRHPVFGTGLYPHLLGVGLVLDMLAGLSERRAD